MHIPPAPPYIPPEPQAPDAGPLLSVEAKASCMGLVGNRGTIGVVVKKRVSLKPTLRSYMLLVTVSSVRLS